MRHENGTRELGLLLDKHVHNKRKSKNRQVLNIL